jgi:hypothetical protein
MELTIDKGTKVEDRPDIVLNYEHIQRIQDFAVNSGPTIFNKEISYSDAQVILTLSGLQLLMADLGIRAQFKLDPEMFQEEVNDV